MGIVRGGAFAEVATLNLRGAQLQGADLAYANFGPLDVVDANLSGARLCGLGRVSQPVRGLAGRLGGCRVLVCCLMPNGLGSNR